MNLLEDIANILIKHKDNEHYLKVEVNEWDVKVYLEYSPNGNYIEKEDEQMLIPIIYSSVDGFAYIPNDEYRKIYNPTDYGIDNTEIKIINDIMEYLVNHKKEIEMMCGKFNINRLKTVKEIKVNKENVNVSFTVGDKTSNVPGTHYTFEINDEENEEDIYD